MAGRLGVFEDIPRPSEGDLRAPVSSLIWLKVLLFWELKAEDMTRADLMRALGCPRNQVDRLFAPRHMTRMDLFDAAFDARGKRVMMMAAQAALSAMPIGDHLIAQKPRPCGRGTDQAGTATPTRAMASR